MGPIRKFVADRDFPRRERVACGVQRITDNEIAFRFRQRSYRRINAVALSCELPSGKDFIAWALNDWVACTRTEPFNPETTVPLAFDMYGGTVDDPFELQAVFTDAALAYLAELTGTDHSRITDEICRALFGRLFATANAHGFYGGRFREH